jgi:cytochrome c556
MTHTFEIRKREKGEHREGHLELMIDGQPAEYTNDPTQHYEKALARRIKAGESREAATVAAQKDSEYQAEYVLQRIADRLRRGSVAPGGVPGAKFGGLDTTPIKSDIARADEKEAVHRFMNRGPLNGLDKSGRAKRVERRNKRTDHEAEWRKNRKELLDHRMKQLDELQKLVKKGDMSESQLEFNSSRIRALTEEIRSLQSPQAASHGFQYAFGQYWQAAVNFVTSDQRLVPCMSNTTVNTEQDAKDQVSDFTTLDEFNGSGYTSGGLALDNQAVNIDDANNRAEFDSDDEAVTLGAGTRSITGNLLLLFVTTLNGSMPEHWLEFATPKTPDGSLFTFQMNAEGLLQMA